MISKARLVALLGALLPVACTPLTAFNRLVPKDEGVRLVAHDIAFGPHPRQRIDLYAPLQSRRGPLPVIVFFYGGSWNSGTKSGYSFVGRALAAQGFLVAIPDYRLVPEVRYPTFLEDNAAAVRWIRHHAIAYGGDGERIILAGHSAGAYAAAMLAVDPSLLGDDRRAVRGLIGLAGPYDFLPFTGPITREAFRGTTELTATQPVNHVARGAPPAFLATGDQDVTVLPRNSDALAERLGAVGTAVVRKRYPRVGHVGLMTAIARPFRGQATVLADMVSFAKSAVVVTETVR